MRILLLTQWFDPEPTVKGLPFARELIRAGHDVHVITGFPNYPGGVVYPGYQINAWTHEMCDGVPVTRVALFPSHNRSGAQRALTYLSFAITASIAGVVTRFKPDVVYVYHPPLTVGLAGTVIGLFRRVPFVYDIQDLWPDTLGATGMIQSGIGIRAVGRVADWVYRRATLLLAQSPGFETRLIERGVPAAKVRLVYNWCDEEALSARADRMGFDPGQFADRFNVVFAGNMGMAQALESVIAAAALVANRNSRVQFVFVGGGTEVASLQRLAQTKGLRNVIFLGRLEMNQMGHVFDHADALLVHLRDSPLFTITLPSKTQAYLYAGKPIIMAVPGDAARLVEQAGAGVCVPSENPAALAEAVTRLADLPGPELAAMGERGRRFYEDALSLARGTGLMIAAFEDAIAAYCGSTPRSENRQT